MRFHSIVSTTLLAVLGSRAEVCFTIEYWTGDTYTYTPPFPDCQEVGYGPADPPMGRGSQEVRRVELSGGEGKWGFKLFSDSHCQHKTWEKDFEGMFEIDGWAASWSCFEL